MDFRRVFGLIGLLLLGLPAVSVGSERSPIPPSSAFPRIADASVSSMLLTQGTEVQINGTTHSVPWGQWPAGETQHLGIADTALTRLLGIQLGSSPQPEVQALQWFTRSTTPTYWSAPYRYLSLNALAQQAGWKLHTDGTRLIIDTQPAQLNRLTQTPDHQRLTLQFSQPPVWERQQDRKNLLLKFSAIADPALLPEIDLVGPDTDETPRWEIRDREFLLRIPLKPGAQPALGTNHYDGTYQLDIYQTPPRQSERVIQWRPGLYWHRQTIAVSAPQMAVREFTVTWLAIPNYSTSNFVLRPITANPDGAAGTLPLAKIAQNNHAIAAINAGFFNRNNQLPLGALKTRQRWHSGPILNRGVIGWNAAGQFETARLTLRERLQVNGESLPITHLNSGYVQAGLARYTPTWGGTYTPITDGEMLIPVVNDTLQAAITVPKANTQAIPIPNPGYLLVNRAQAVFPDLLPAGASVNLTPQTVPTWAETYPELMGAGPLLLQNGNIVLDALQEGFSPAFNRQKAQRSAIGITTDQTLLLVTVSEARDLKGASLAELAQIMQRLRAHQALNLDGGSSTALALGNQLINRPPATAARVHNGLGLFERFRN
ncbi:MAG: phosphodiester glycosidase family protein [Cyanobacteria bacterium P01_H01_bin.15]